MTTVGGIQLPELPDWTPVAFDTEASGLFVDGDKGSPPARVSVVSVAWFDPDSDRLVSHAWPFDQGFVPGKPGRIKDFVEYELALPKRLAPNWPDTSYNLDLDEWINLVEWLKRRPRLVAHNAKYDLHIMKAGLRLYGEGVDLHRQVVWDTMLIQGLVEPLRSTALKSTARRVWGEEEGLEQEEVLAALKTSGVGLTHRYDLVDWETMRPYATKDAELTIRLWNRQINCLNEGHWGGWGEFDNQIELDLELMRFLFRMESRGVGFNAEDCRQEAVKAEKMIARVAEALPFSPGINSAKRYYFGSDSVLKLVPYETTKEGAVSLTASVLGRMAQDGVPHAERYAALAKLQSSVSKWYRGWPNLVGPDGRLRANFRQNRIESDRVGGKSGGAISARLSVERVQLQAIPHDYQIPKGLRNPQTFIEPAPGHELWNLDMSQAEVRIATWASRCKNMAKVLRMGSDVHGSTAKLVFQVDEDHKDWDKYRQVAKRLTFAMIYGAGVRTTRAQILEFTGIDYSEAKTRAMINDYRSTFPEFTETANRAQAKADIYQGGPGFVQLVSGRKRWFGWGERTHKAFNAVIQGGQAEALKYWMLATDQKWPGIIVLTVHDSIWIEVLKEQAREIVMGVQLLGSQTLEGLFSRPSLPIQFPIDAKRVA